LGSATSTTTRYFFFFLFVIGSFLLPVRGWKECDTASFLHCIERDDYTDKCYVD
jgi:hypothetical protein